MTSSGRNAHRKGADPEERYVPERKIQVERRQVRAYIAWTILDAAVTRLEEWRDSLPSVVRWETSAIRTLQRHRMLVQAPDARWRDDG